MQKSLLILFILFIARAGKAQQSEADSLYGIGNYSKAIQLYEKAEDKSARTSYQIGRAYQQLGNPSMAENYYQKAFQRDSTFLKAGLNFGRLLRQNHKYAKADSIFTDLTRRYPDNPNFHYQLGMVKEREKDSTGLPQFKKTLQLNPNHQNALYYAAVYNFNQHHYDNVEALGKQALKSYPDNISILRLLGKNATKLEDYHLAIARYKKITEELHPETKDYKALGYAYYNVYDYKNAIKAFEKIVEKDDEDAEILYNLGLLYHREGKYKKAEELFSTVIALKKMGLDQQYQSLALVYKSMEKYGLAIRYFKLALAENPMLMRSQYEMAICADNYYEDLKTKREYYQSVIDKFKDNEKAAQYIKLSKYRIKELNKKIFLKGDDEPPANQVKN